MSGLQNRGGRVTLEVTSGAEMLACRSALARRCFSSPSTELFDVAIVGGGPVGNALAVSLGKSPSIGQLLCF